MTGFLYRHRPLAFQFFKFGLIGFGGFLVDFAMFSFALHVLELGRVASAFFSFPFAVTFTWMGNRLFTFAGAPHRPLISQWVRFVSVCLIGIVFNRGTYTFLVLNFALIHQLPVLGLITGTLVGMSFNFLISRKLVFR